MQYDNLKFHTLIKVSPLSSKVYCLLNNKNPTHLKEKMSLQCTFHFLLLNISKMSSLMFPEKLTLFPSLEFLFFQINQIDKMSLFYNKTCISY
jgi:hypothetical protein